MVPDRRRGVLTIVLAVAALAILGGLLPKGPSVVDAFDPSLRSTLLALRPLLDLLNTAGSLPVWAGLVAIEAVATRRVRPAVAIVAVGLATEAVGTLVRAVVDRPRPVGATATDLLVAAGFPSGHVARTVVFAAALAVAVPWLSRHPRVWILLGIVLTALMAVARVDASAHYLSDTLGGVLLGAGAVAAWSLAPQEWRGEASRDAIGGEGSAMA